VPETRSPDTGGDVNGKKKSRPAERQYGHLATQVEPKRDRRTGQAPGREEAVPSVGNGSGGGRDRRVSTWEQGEKQGKPGHKTHLNHQRGKKKGLVYEGRASVAFIPEQKTREKGWSGVDAKKKDEVNLQSNKKSRLTKQTKKRKGLDEQISHTQKIRNENGTTFFAKGFLGNKGRARKKL